jgi:hypothetical protein
MRYHDKTWFISQSRTLGDQAMVTPDCSITQKVANFRNVGSDYIIHFLLDAEWDVTRFIRGFHQIRAQPMLFDYIFEQLYQQ